LAVTSTLGVLMTACFIGVFILAARQATQSSSPLYGLYILCSLAGIGGLLVTAGALVWASVIAIRLKRWGWTVALVVGTLALVVVTIFSAPGLLILVFAVWGPDAPRQGPPPKEAIVGTHTVPPDAAPGSS
jgi:hypothetical protein